MDLKDFIQETLSQIAEGIRLADAAVIEHGAAVNPANVVTNKSGDGPYGFLATDGARTYRRAVESIEFDVVITANEGKESKGGLGIHVGAIGVGASQKNDNSNSTASRIRFRVPMMLPLSKSQ